MLAAKITATKKQKKIEEIKPTRLGMGIELVNLNPSKETLPIKQPGSVETGGRSLFSAQDSITKRPANNFALIGNKNQISFTLGDEVEKNTAEQQLECSLASAKSQGCTSVMTVYYNPSTSINDAKNFICTVSGQKNKVFYIAKRDEQSASKQQNISNNNITAQSTQKVGVQSSSNMISNQVEKVPNNAKQQNISNNNITAQSTQKVGLQSSSNMISNQVEKVPNNAKQQNISNNNITAQSTQEVKLGLVLEQLFPTNQAYEHHMVQSCLDDNYFPYIRQRLQENHTQQQYKLHEVYLNCKKELRLKENSVGMGILEVEYNNKMLGLEVKYIEHQRILAEAYPSPLSKAFRGFFFENCGPFLKDFYQQHNLGNLAPNPYFTNKLQKSDPDIIRIVLSKFEGLFDMFYEKFQSRGVKMNENREQLNINLINALEQVWRK